MARAYYWGQYHLDEIVDHSLCQRVEVSCGQRRDTSCDCSMQPHENDDIIQIGSYFRTDSDL